jgi:NAD(P)-dependent dehydrogenase (short-subunit alcohol dehydrogenase family)
MTSSPHRPLVLVTGGAKRLGRQVLEAFARAGYDCLVHARQSAAEAGQLASALQAGGARAQVLLHDIADPAASAAALLDGALRLFGRLPDASVLSAASYDLDDALAPDAAMLQRQLALNFLFPVQFCAALAARIQSGGAPGGQAAADHSATLFTDYKVQRVNRDFFSYSLSKHALEGSLPYLAVAYGPWLRVNAIAPGPVLAAHGMTQAALNQRVAAESATGRHPTPEDIARTALYLAQTPSLVGQHICVDAGARFDARTREVCLDSPGPQGTAP